MPRAWVQALEDEEKEVEEGSSSQGESLESHGPGHATSTEAALWHWRLGHMSEKGLTYLMKDGALADIKDMHLGKCEECLARKKHQVSFRTEQITKVEKLKLIHSDVCGAMSV